jgi:hypothetical protein
VADPPIFRAFFSYARHDVVTDTALLTDFKVTLENQVNARLVGARFAIWRDEEEIRTGDGIPESRLSCAGQIS